MQKLIYSHEGAPSPDELDWETPLLYQGSTPLYDKTSDPARNILNSVNFPPEIAQQLAKIEGKCQLTQTNGVLRYAHVFSTEAKYVDGLERICYLEYRENEFRVREFNGSKTAKYSAFFPLLCEQLRTAGFVENKNGAFLVTNNQIPKLVELINLLIRWRSEGKLELVAARETDVISTMKVQRYFYKAFWQMRSVNQDSQSKDQEPELPIQKQASMFFDRIVENLKCARSIEELESAKAEINWLQEEIATIDDLAQSLENYLQRKKYN